MDEFLLQTNAITKEFKNIKAVDHIDLKLKRSRRIRTRRGRAFDLRNKTAAVDERHFD